MRDIIVLDSEVLPSHYLFCARRLSDGKLRVLWGHKPQDMEVLGALLHSRDFTWVGFNSAKFDMPIALAAAGGATLRELKAMANDIIENNKPLWMTLRDSGIELPEDFDQIDLIEVAPGVIVSLKLYGGRMASPSLIDMPFHHEDWITDEQAQNVLLPYCINDIDETTRLYRKLEGQIALRQKMSERYDIDLRSKSDAQMAETIIAKELGLLRAGRPDMPKTVRYMAPDFVQPVGMVLQDILTRVKRHTFEVAQSNGAVQLPEFLEKEPVLIGDGVFQMGIGGLHSKHDKCIEYIAGEDFVIRDADVGAYYPNILLNAEYVPRGLGARFVEVYRSFVTERLAAKARAKKLSKLPTLSTAEEAELAECKVLDAGGKIMINGTFGKLGSCFSKIYSPDLMLGITLTGQFYLLALIEHLTTLGVKVLSANTDGVTFGGTPAKVEEATKFIEMYGWLSNFEFEFVDYRRIAFKDCNNYIAVKTNGEVKAKGLYAPSGLMKNPTNEVCSLAAQAYLATGRPVKDFILEHFRIENFADFLQVRTVKGGAVQYAQHALVDDWFEVEPGEWARPSWDLNKRATHKRKSRPAPVMTGSDPAFLGRVVRWYYSTRPGLSINYASNGNLVPKSEGGMPCMALPDKLPGDVDVQRYIDETVAHLHSMGVNA